jgi:hypothetical protein
MLSPVSFGILTAATAASIFLSRKGGTKDKIKNFS